MKLISKVAVGGTLLASTGVACAGALVIAALEIRKRRSGTLDGKVVLITGASRGLGLALAEEFGRRGARLALTARDAYELDRAQSQLLRKNLVAPENLFVFPADLVKQEDAKQLIERTTAHFGRIDILVNNAGVIAVGPVENQTVENFREVMNSNFFSGLHCTLSLLPQMLARREGSIVNIASIGGKIPVPHLLPYTASKFAMVGFSEGLNAELRSKGIRVTTVCPGLMRTGSHLNAVFTGDAEREYRWFSLAASLPLISTSARSAARKIVSAVAAGRSEVTVTPQAMVAARLGNLSPEAVSLAMHLMNLALPSPVAGTPANHRGSDVRRLEITAAVVLGQAAARNYNETS
jgi:short-subunit dehydrogenase